MDDCDQMKIQSKARNPPMLETLSIRNRHSPPEAVRMTPFFWTNDDALHNLKDGGIHSGQAICTVQTWRGGRGTA